MNDGNDDNDEDCGEIDIQSQLPTFDQLLVTHNGDVMGVSIKPNTSYVAEVVFEPVHKGKRVSFRTADHRVLCAFICSEGSLTNLNATVALYSSMKELMNVEINGVQPQEETSKDEAEKSLKELEKMVAWLRKSLKVINETQATRQRAFAVARLAEDARILITNEASSFKGMKAFEQSAPT